MFYNPKPIILHVRSVYTNTQIHKHKIACHFFKLNSRNCISANLNGFTALGQYIAQRKYGNLDARHIVYTSVYKPV